MQKQQSGKYLKDSNAKIRKNKAHDYIRDTKAVYDYLKKNTATATMVAVALNIYRPNLCRIKRALEISGLLWETHRSICTVTRQRASYLTTDPQKAPFQAQLKLFSEGGGSL